MLWFKSTCTWITNGYMWINISDTALQITYNILGCKCFLVKWPTKAQYWNKAIFLRNNGIGNDKHILKLKVHFLILGRFYMQNQFSCICYVITHNPHSPKCFVFTLSWHLDQSICSFNPFLLKSVHVYLLFNIPLQRHSIFQLVFT